MPRPATPEDAMRGFLSGEDPGLARFRRVMRRVPHGPNCKLCAAPFEGPGGACCAMSVRPVPRQPGDLQLLHQGPEQGRGLRRRDPGEPPLRRHPRLHRDRRALEPRPSSARSSIASTGSPRGHPRQRRHGRQVRRRRGDRPLLRRNQRGRPHGGRDSSRSRTARGRRASGRDKSGPIPVGAAVHTGIAFVGSTATDGAVSDFTALGDVVNTTARLGERGGRGRAARLHRRGARRRPGLALPGAPDAQHPRPIRRGRGRGTETCRDTRLGLARSRVAPTSSWS